MTWAIENKGYSQRRACGLVGMEPRVYRYRPSRPDDAGLRKRLRDLAAERRRFGVNDRGIRTPHFRVKGALTHSRCGDRLSCTDEARLEQINLSAAVHLPLDEFELGDLAFGLAIRPRRDNGVADCGDVLFYPVCKRADKACLCALESSVQFCDPL